MLRAIDAVVLAGAIATACAGPPVTSDPMGELVVASEGASLITSEAGESFDFTVRLSAAPRSEVRVPIRSDDETEALVSPAELVFGPDDWGTPRTVTVTGTDDTDVDSGQTYHVVIGPSVADHRAFDGLTAASLTCTNVDDDAPSIAVVQLSSTTSELGGTASFRVVLATRPSADVTIGLSSTRPSEGVPENAAMTFTASNWNAPQTVSVRGVDDDADDGDQTFEIELASPESTDAAYAALEPPAPLTFTNVDDEGTVIVLPSVSDPVVTTIATSSLPDVSYGGYLNGESYQQDILLTHGDYQYTAYWNAAGRVILARRPVDEPTWTRIELDPSYTTSGRTDSHHTISLGVSPNDGALHIAFDMHDSSLRYVRSVPGLLDDPAGIPWATASFSAWTDRLSGTPLTAITYPRFITEPSGRLLFEARVGGAGNGDSVLWEYDAGTWTSLGAYLSGRRASDTINAYIHGIEYQGTRLHVTWCWRDTPDPSSNHGLFYAYSDDDARTWRNGAGVLVASIGSSPIVESSAGITAWDIPRNRGYINQEHMVVDHAGRVHVLVTHMPDAMADDVDFTRARASAQYFHYWRDTGGTWNRVPMTFPAQLNFRGKLAVTAEDDLVAILPNIRIAAASAEANWTNWTLVDMRSDGRYFSDPLVDRSRLRLEDHITIFAPRTSVASIVSIEAIDLVVH